MRRNKTLTGLLAAFALFTAGQVSAETYKVSFVEVARLMRDAPQVEAVRKRLKKEFSRRDEELVAQQKQVKKLEEKLQRDGAIMSEAEATEIAQPFPSNATSAIRLSESTTRSILTLSPQSGLKPSADLFASASLPKCRGWRE